MKRTCVHGADSQKLTAKICHTHGTEVGRSVTIIYLIPECHYCSLLTATYKCLFAMQVMHKYSTCTIEAKLIELTAEKFTVSYMNFNLPSRKIQCLVGTMQNQFLTNSRLCVVSYKWKQCMVAVSSSKWEQVQQTHIKTNNQSCNYDLGLVDYLDSKP
jgi:hypothetical protein